MNAVKKILDPRLVLLLSFLLFPSLMFAQHYTETDLVSSIPLIGTNPTNGHDTQLVNAWGLTRSAASPWWISDNGTGLATVYNGVGTKVQTLIVTIPVPPGVTTHASPTGAVVNGTPTDFLLPTTPSVTAKFIFVTEEGVIAGWNSGSAAVIAKDNSKKGAVYKGCTIAEWNGKHYLYVTNFHSGEVEVYDSTFTRVTLDKHAFEADDDDDVDFDHDRGNDRFDDHRRNFAPFNVQAIGTNLYVTFAKQDRDKHDEVDGAGLGFVDVFNPAGRRLARLQRGSWFNAPWGVALAPGEFGEFSHSLLVGMFGDGQIAAFNPVDGSFIGLMKKHDDSILTIPGLWALSFGAGNTNSGPYNTLYFTAGPNEESDGLFGNLVVDSTTTELGEVDEP
jgi:uncharacterized protein (TIGR03118 family)